MTTALADVLAAHAIACRPAARLAAYTTFQLGGACPLLILCQTADQVVTAATELRARALGWCLIGGGSNLLVADSGVDRIVVRYASDLPDIRLDEGLVHVSGATSFDALAHFAVANGLGGLVNASGIPGTVGGAIVGNAGAFGWQIADALHRVRLLEPDGTIHHATPAEIGFSYRDSGLKHTGRIVLDAILQPPAADASWLHAERLRILDLRATKHPDITREPCAGSFFRNVEPTSAAERRQAAGWFLEQAGAKAMHEGGARIFDRHANIIVKADPACRAADVLTLSQRMADAVQARFGFNLIREVQLLGDFGG